MGSLGEGFRVLHELALRGHSTEIRNLRQKLYDELTWEGQKFFMFREAKMVAREITALHRLRSLNVMLRFA